MDGPSNKAPITGHSLRVVIGKTGVHLSKGSLLELSFRSVSGFFDKCAAVDMSGGW